MMSKDQSSLPSCSAEERVRLDAQWVDAELEAAPFVVERVDHQHHVVVLDEGVDRVAVHQVRPDLPTDGSCARHAA